MRVPRFAKYAGWMAGTGLFCAGMVVGAALFLSLYHDRFSQVSIENGKLAAEISELQKQISTDNAARSRNNSIWKLSVFIEQSPGDAQPDPLTVSELTQMVRQKLDSLRGKPVSVLQANPLAYYQLVEEPVYRTGSGKSYRLKIRLMTVLQSELGVHLTARPEQVGGIEGLR